MMMMMMMWCYVISVGTLNNRRHLLKKIRSRFNCSSENRSEIIIAIDFEADTKTSVII